MFKDNEWDFPVLPFVSAHALDNLLLALRASREIIETSLKQVPPLLARAFESALERTARLRTRLDEDGALRPSSHLIVNIARLKSQTIDELACAKFFDGLLLAEYQQSLRTTRRTRQCQLLNCAR